MCANLTAPALAAEDTADTAAPGQTAITFTDMPSSPEFVESITWAVENGITTGMYDGQFWPDYTCNISQILTFIWRMSGSPEPAGENPFRDVPNGKWYAAAAVWAHEKGIVSGDTLHPDAPLHARHDRHLSLAARRFAVCVRVGIPRRKEHGRLCCRRRVGARRTASSRASPRRSSAPTTPARARIVTFLHRYSASILAEAPAEM